MRRLSTVLPSAAGALARQGRGRALQASAPPQGLRGLSPAWHAFRRSAGCGHAAGWSTTTPPISGARIGRITCSTSCRISSRMRDDATGKFEHIQVVQIWVDPKFPDAHRDPALRPTSSAARGGLIGLVRWDNEKAIAIFPPALSATGNGMNRQATFARKNTRPKNFSRRLPSLRKCGAACRPRAACPSMGRRGDF